ncbi:type VI secretion system lipoprotein TssJ [Campylobacter aviculae]|uniref:Type VI secretion system lipoprotein TssJ n=1 Tax=Campylobacter aviculae TaxID=2510190 RepID=A0A4U7BK75_9BACT|nr:type VI secretion system lipoprotein TssJ [Campylobacter aviculae]TKX30615.1 type VI secretion system lipoprotein TssJ [Campylobacter aviculae]
MFYKKILVFMFILFILNACSSTVSIKINNMQNSNLNNRSDDVPLTVIVYQLKDVKKFEESNDLELATREDGVLGKDKIDSIKLQIAPEDSVVAVKVDDEEVPYIGVFALFANNANKVTKTWAKTDDASGFGSSKTLKFEITQKGVKKIK